MKNYKIRVNSDAESKEAQDLFEKPGYEKGACGTGEYPATIIAATKSMYRDTPFSSQATRLNHDAHKDYIELDFKQLRAIVVEKDGLISGADALRALADGEEVEYNERMSGWTLVDKNTSFGIFLEDQRKAFKCYLFRLKPRTIKLEIEIPAPFEPKEGEDYWHIEGGNLCGYAKRTMYSVCLYSQFGVWRTEEDVKKAVEQLRKLGVTK